MRKRTQYTKPKYQSKIPTLVIMIVMLACILYFGKTMSQNIAGFFAPSVPVTDEPLTDTAESQKPENSGSVVSGASKTAARNILNLIAKGARP